MDLIKASKYAKTAAFLGSTQNSPIRLKIFGELHKPLLLARDGLCATLNKLVINLTECSRLYRVNEEDLLSTVSLIRTSHAQVQYALSLLINVSQKENLEIDFRLGADVTKYFYECHWETVQDLMVRIQWLEMKMPRQTALYHRLALSEKLIVFISEIFKLDLIATTKREIKRSITFPPEYKEAGISILNYFSHVISNKYPEIEVGVTIEQFNNKVTLRIQTQEGKEEIIEQELNDYGLVVTGKIKPEQYLTDRTETLMLQYKLDMAKMEAQHTKELLYSERKQYDARIETLETTMASLMLLLDKEKTNNHLIVRELKEASVAASETIQKSIENIIAVIEATTTSNREITIASLSTIKKDNPNLYDWINEIVVKGSLQGVAGNFLYGCLQQVSKMF